jgi:3-deoxy-D-manno-octulosonic-acid transferase
MKFDQGAPELQENRLGDLIDRVFINKNRLIFIAASTHPGEELIMVRAFKVMVAAFPFLELILAPRHIERANEVEKLLKKENIHYALLTDLVKSGGNVPNSPPITGSISGGLKKRALLVNTTGELRSLYAISDIVFIGKSLGENRGGHNIIEPAIFGKPIIFGRNMDNFRQVAKIFKENNAAIEVDNEKDFLVAFHRLLSDPAERKRLEKISKETVAKNRGAINKTIDLLRGDN